MENREAWLAAVFVELADTLVAEFDLVDFLGMLSERCAELLDGPHVGVMLVDARGNLRHVASSTEQMAVVEVLELQYDEGPCPDCCRTARPVLNQRLDTALQRWPNFAPVAIEAGYRMVTTLPMRARDNVIGAMNIFHNDLEPIEPLEMRITQALADAATIGILQERSFAGAAELAAQLQSALDSRIVIEQAKGMISAQTGRSVDEAFTLLRSYARAHNERIADVARRVLDRSCSAEDLVMAQEAQPEIGAKRSRSGR